MQFDAATIERMVRDVLKQIQPSGNSKPQPPATNTLLAVPTTNPAAPKETQKPATAARIVITDRVITADLLKEQARFGSQLVIASKAIITPAAQDYLRLNQITWERGATSTASEGLGTTQWRILLSSVNESVKRAVETLCLQRSNVKRELVGTAADAAIGAVSAISRGEVPGIVVVTSAPHVVACRVNRHQSLRAAVAVDLKSWSVMATTLHPNVVCIDPNERSFMELQNLLNRIVSGPTPVAPAGWIE